MAVTGATDEIFSAEQLLARSKAAAANKGSSAGKSKIQQMLEGTEDTSDRVDLSPVAKLLQAKQAEKAKTATPYTEQEWYTRAKVDQLRAQLAIYSSVPGLDPSGAVMSGIEAEIRSIIEGQQEKLKASTDEAAKKQAELAKLEAEKAAAPMSAEDMLKRARGESTDAPISAEVKALLDKVKKGTTVNQSA